jgi:hypothetical protein
MKRLGELVLLVGVGVGIFFAPQSLHAQSCKDETDMLDGSKQALMDFVLTVNKESVPQFERADEQKSAVSRLGIHIGMLKELVACLAKAEQDTTAPKANAEAAKAQDAAAAKLLEKIQHEQSDIKAAKASKDAKALVGKLDLTD